MSEIHLNPSEILEHGDHGFAVGLHWQSLGGHGGLNRQIAAVARTNKSGLRCSRYVRHAATRSAVVEEDSFGFYKGAAPRLGKGRQVYSLASNFARHAEAQAVLLMNLGERYAIIGVKNGHPVLDALCSLEQALEAARSFKRYEVPTGAALYLAGDVDEQIESGLIADYPNIQPSLPEFTTPDAETRLRSIPGNSLLPVLLIAIITALGWTSWEWWQERQMLLNAMKENLGPEDLYVRSRDAELAQVSMTSARAAVQALRDSALWSTQASVADWRLDQIACRFDAGGSSACTRNWTRAPMGTWGSLQAALESPVQPMDIDSASDVVSLDVERYELDLQTLQPEREIRIEWGGWMQRLKTMGELGSAAAGANKLTGFKPQLDAAKLVGQWPLGEASTTSRELVKGGSWSASGDVLWLAQLMQLPDAFLLDDVVIALDASSGEQLTFKANGIYLAR